MTRHRIALWSLLAVLALTLTLTWIGTSGCNKKAEEVTIGVIAPLTGDGATYGAAMKRGFELATAGRNIRLIYEDSKLQPKEGVTAIQKLISQDKVKVVFGAAASGVTLAMAPIAERNGVILFSSISTTDELKNAGQYVFRNVPRNEIQGVTAADFVHDVLKCKRPAILKKNDEYGTNLADSFADRIAALGDTVVFDEAYNPGETDFRTTITKIKKQNPGMVYIPGNYQEVAVFLVQAKEAGLKVPLVGGDGSYSPELINLAGDAANGSYYTMMAVKKQPFYDSFEAAFKAKYNRDPDVYDAYAYEAGIILLTAIDSVGYDATKIKDFLLKHRFEESLTGPLTFDEFGEVNRQYGIVTVKNGQFEFLE